jgi:hypothetical protein
MKKTTLNQIFNFKINLISVQHLLCLSIKRVVMLLIFSTSFINMSAQNGNTVTPTVIDINKHISSLKTNNTKMRMNSSNSQYIENLVFGIQPAIYFNSGAIKTYGDAPVKLFTDIPSLNSLSNAEILKGEIEIIVIKINKTSEINSKIDLLKFSDFNKLKYIYILSSVSTSEQKIANMFINYNQQYSIFYKIENAE